MFWQTCIFTPLAYRTFYFLLSRKDPQAPFQATTTHTPEATTAPILITLITLVLCVLELHINRTVFTFTYWKHLALWQGTFNVFLFLSSEILWKDLKLGSHASLSRGRMGAGYFSGLKGTEIGQGSLMASWDRSPRQEALGSENPERGRRWKWQPTPVLLPGRLHGRRSLAGYSPGGHRRVWHNWTTKQRRTPSSCPGWRAPPAPPRTAWGTAQLPLGQLPSLGF